MIKKHIELTQKQIELDEAVLGIKAMQPTSSASSADFDRALVQDCMKALCECTASELDALSPHMLEHYQNDVKRVLRVVFDAANVPTTGAAPDIGATDIVPQVVQAPIAANECSITTDNMSLTYDNKSAPIVATVPSDMPELPEPHLVGDAFSAAQMRDYGLKCRRATIAEYAAPISTVPSEPVAWMVTTISPPDTKPLTFMCYSEADAVATQAYFTDSTITPLYAAPSTAAEQSSERNQTLIAVVREALEKVLKYPFAPTADREKCLRLALASIDMLKSAPADKGNAP